KPKVIPITAIIVVTANAIKIELPAAKNSCIKTSRPYSSAPKMRDFSPFQASATKHQLKSSGSAKFLKMSTLITWLASSLIYQAKVVTNIRDNMDKAN